MDRSPIEDHPHLSPLAIALMNCSTAHDAAILSHQLPKELTQPYKEWNKMWNNLALRSRIWALVEAEMSDRGVDVPHACRALKTIPARPSQIYSLIVAQVAMKLFGTSAFVPNTPILHEKVQTVTMGFLYHSWNKQVTNIKRCRTRIDVTMAKAEKAWQRRPS